ncbi:MAG: hypothetical protein KZQ76_10180 [Candidatus Thiodiazotropha sp. (ex Epidulcina cf. delphinae)]|nr:hypothetical protein [Candidatus Thiodiazotropha sp. (ex Epidulcina cf. delphinae)]
MSGLARFLTVFSLMALLAACGGGDAEAPWDPATTPGESETIDDVGTGQAVILLGSGSGSSFNPGELSVAVTSLSAGGQTTVTATLADADGNLFQESATVTFATDCLATGLATIDTSVDAVGGVATATYVAQGCSGADAIRATTTVNGNTTTATGTINVQPAEIGSMEFISAEPPLIGLRGVGLIEVSRVTFKVLDKNGNPVPQQAVNFSLNVSVGGVSIPAGAEKATSDINGVVGTDVKSGTVSTTMRVTATLEDNPLISSQSDGLVVSTGVSDQDSISLSAEVFNPETWRFDGVKVGITVHAADHFNNPVPDGTAIYFTTEGGQIQSQCQIADGACSVNWTSSNPRPPVDGRVTILASMLGEESFLDANGNGVLDQGDTAFARIPEAFRDDDEDGLHDQGLEEFIDFNSNSLYDGEDSDPNYNGVLCCDNAAVAAAQEAVVAGDDPGICFDVTPINTLSCSAEKNINVRDALVLVMSDSDATILFDGVDLTANDVVTPVVDISGGLTNLVFTIMDFHGQVMPAGTTISFESSNGKIESGASFEVPSTNGRLIFYTVQIAPDENEEESDKIGTLRVSVVTPGGAISGGSVIIDDSDFESTPPAAP